MIGILEYHRIHIILKDESGQVGYGTRSWKNVPRKGESIMLRNFKDDTHFLAEVLEVVWGVAVDDMDQKWPDINLLCERRTP